MRNNEYEVDNYLKYIKKPNNLQKYNMNKFINKVLDKCEVDNYLKYNEKPRYLQKKTTYNSTFYRYCYQPIEKKLIPFEIMPSNLSTVEETIKKCEKLQNIILNKENVTYEECPVCYTEFSTTNYILPKCGHKICISCFTNNARQNREGSNLCCLCRSPVLHT